MLGKNTALGSVKALRPTEKQVRAFVERSATGPKYSTPDSTYGRGGMVVDLRTYRAFDGAGCLAKYPDAKADIEANLGRRMAGYGLELVPGDPTRSIDAMARKAQAEWDAYEINGYTYDDFMDATVSGFVCMWEFENGMRDKLPEWMTEPEHLGVTTPEQVEAANRRMDKTLADVVEAETRAGRGDSDHVRKLKALLEPKPAGRSAGPGPEALAAPASGENAGKNPNRSRNLLSDLKRADPETGALPEEGDDGPSGYDDALRAQQARAKAAGLSAPRQGRDAVERGDYGE